MTPADLIGQWRTKADDLMRAAKGYHCRSTEAIKTGLIKQAAQARMCADDLEKSLAEAGNAQAASADDQHQQGEDATAYGAVVEAERVSQATDGPSPASQERQDQDAGQLDMPSLRDGHDGTGRGSQGSPQPRRQRGRCQPAEPV